MNTILKNVIKIITLPNPPQSHMHDKVIFAILQGYIYQNSDLTNLSFQLPLTKLTFIIYSVYTYVILVRSTK